MNFNLYKFTLKSLEPIKLPYYSGFAFRGLFGNALRKTVCVLKSSDTTCDKCILVDKCIYSIIFESPATENIPHALKGTSNTPHPFIITPDRFDMQFEKVGSLNVLYLTLFGKAIEYLPFLIFSFERMGEIGIGKDRGKFVVKEVEQYVGFDQLRVIYSRGDSEIKREDFRWTFDHFKALDFSGDTLTLKSVTPVRLKRDNRFVKNDITLSDILFSLKRRFISLSTDYCTDSIQFPTIEELSEGVRYTLRSSSWLDLSRYSSRQDTTMKMGGVMFEATLNGNLKKIYPYLKLGEFLQIGKNVSFGLGKIVLS